MIRSPFAHVLSPRLAKRLDRLYGGGTRRFHLGVIRAALAPGSHQHREAQGQTGGSFLHCYFHSFLLETNQCEPSAKRAT